MKKNSKFIVSFFLSRFNSALLIFALTFFKHLFYMLQIEDIMGRFKRLNFKRCQRLPEKAQFSDSRFKEIISRLEKKAKTHAIVDALIATVTFAAGTTVPGGFVQDGRNAGSAILMKNDSFKAFIIIDAIAMLLSTSALFIYVIMPTWPHSTRVTFAVRRFCYYIATFLSIFAMSALVLAFATGTYAVLAHSLSLAIATSIIGLGFFIIIVIVSIGWVKRFVESGKYF